MKIKFFTAITFVSIILSSCGDTATPANPVNNSNLAKDKLPFKVEIHVGSFNNSPDDVKTYPDSDAAGERIDLVDSNSKEIIGTGTVKDNLSIDFSLYESKLDSGLSKTPESQCVSSNGNFKQINLLPSTAEKSLAAPELSIGGIIAITKSDYLSTVSSDRKPTYDLPKYKLSFTYATEDSTLTCGSNILNLKKGWNTLKDSSGKLEIVAGSEEIVLVNIRLTADKLPSFELKLSDNAKSYVHLFDDILRKVIASAPTNSDHVATFKDLPVPDLQSPNYIPSKACSISSTTVKLGYFHPIVSNSALSNSIDGNQSILVSVSEPDGSRPQKGLQNLFVYASDNLVIKQANNTYEICNTKVFFKKGWNLVSYNQGEGISKALPKPNKLALLDYKNP